MSDVYRRKARQATAASAKRTNPPAAAGHVSPHDDAEQLVVWNHAQHSKAEVEIFYKPHTLTALLVSAGIIFALGLHCENSVTSARNGVHAAIAVFLLFSAVQLPDGLFRRPHPVFWRVLLGISLLYLCLLVFIFFQPLDEARLFFKHFDERLGQQVVLPLYAEDCRMTLDIIWDKLDIFILAHFAGWFVKALLLRNWFILWTCSILWEIVELTFINWLPNFAECWWDQVLLDILICNGLGMCMGMYASRLLEMKSYDWVGFKAIPTIGGKVKRFAQQFTPVSWMTVQWKVFSSARRTGQALLVIAALTLVELNAFFLKAILWIPSEHALNLWRLALWVGFGAPALREFYQFVSDPTIKKLGTQCWVAIAVMLTETAITIKFGRLVFEQAIPPLVGYLWLGAGVALSLVYAAWYLLVRDARELFDGTDRTGQGAKYY